MMTVKIENDVKKAADMLVQLLNKDGPVSFTVAKQDNTVRIVEDGKDASCTLKDQLFELEDSLFFSKRGVLYSTLMDIIEKPLFEHILDKVEGNQVKAARVFGLNRNTIRAKMKRLGIDPKEFRTE
jgi:DNA-binding protein Fis